MAIATCPTCGAAIQRPRRLTRPCRPAAIATERLSHAIGRPSFVIVALTIVTHDAPRSAGQTDRHQLASDHDQTSSDHDQSASGSDQQTADADQRRRG